MQSLSQQISNLGTIMVERFERVDRRFEQVESRLGRIESWSRTADSRFDRLERRMDGLTEQVGRMHETVVRLEYHQQQMNVTLSEWVVPKLRGLLRAQGQV